MKKKQLKFLRLRDEQLASLRMEAINIAARLPEPQPAMYGGMSGGPGTPGKSATKVVADAREILLFVTAKS